MTQPLARHRVAITIDNGQRCLIAHRRTLLGLALPDRSQKECPPRHQIFESRPTETNPEAALNTLGNRVILSDFQSAFICGKTETPCRKDFVRRWQIATRRSTYRDSCTAGSDGPD